MSPILQVSVKGGRRQGTTEEEVGRQHQGMDRPEFAKSQGALENREKQSKLVVKSSVVPQRQRG